jgi:nicotinamide-nucleotide amidase
MVDDASLEALAADVVDRLRDAGLEFATAESCTGGWIAKSLTDVAGSSDVLGYGVVSYSNEAKQALLGVRAETLEVHGAVSEATVIEMATGILELSGADLAVAVSGVAGPGGGTEEKPVGTVWFGWSRRAGDRVESDAERKRFDGGRDDVRRQTVLYALEGVRKRLK